MKKSRILTIIALVLVALLSFTACDALLDLINPTPDTLHACESVCSECGNCLDAECTDAACATKCQGHKTPDEDPVDPAHKCEHVCETCGLCLDADCTESACASKCEGHEAAPEHKCESVCPECGLCLDAECTDAACASKCAGHVQATTPVISVIPPELEINAGEEIDLMFGVTVSDEGDEDPRLIIEDDDGFDAEVEGTYTITYYAVNKFGNSATATRTVIVNKALSALTLEVQSNRLGENKWTGNLLNFINKEYVVLNGSATLDAVSGVFYNSTDSEITLSVGGEYGVSAIITANGVVIEGRDGANSRLMNQSNPIRTSSTVSTININGENVTVASAFAKNMVIPAGGYAIVVQNGYCGTTVDSDGRGYMNYNVIWSYGNVVKLFWADNAEVLTPYVDQAPVITGHDSIVYAGNSEFVLDTEVLKGVTATDDNGTFDPKDNVSITVTIKDNGGFDINKPGKYTVTLEATDGVNTTTVTRIVEVTTSSVEIKINNNSYTTLEDLVAIDKDLDVIGKYIFVIYTPNYNGGINWTNGHGEAFVINQYGEVVRVYDGANGKYYDADNKGGIVDSNKCAATSYLTQAFNSLSEGEYLLVAPNSGSNQSRTFLLSNRTIGAKVVIPGITFVHKCESVCVQCGLCLDVDCTDAACANKCQGHIHNCEDVCEVCAKCTSDCENEVCAAKCDCVTVVVGDKSLKVLAGTIAIDVATPTLGSYNFVVYTYEFKKNNPELSYNNGWGQAFIINQYGQVVRIYDGVSGGKYFDAYNLSGIVDSSITTAGNTLKDAYASLSEGEILILGANGGMNGNAGRTFLGGVRVVGALATIPGVTFEALPEHACESACADCGKCMDATCIMPACLAKCKCHRCESICSKCNGCLDPACTEKACETKCSCHDCESLCAICGGCKDTECTNEVCAKKCICEMTPAAGKYVAINGTYFLADTFYYNEDVTKDTCHKRQLVIFDKNYTGEITSATINGYGVAFVLDANGVFVKAYTWEGIYAYGQDKKAIDYPAGDGSYAARAWSELKSGETLVIFANGAATTPADVRKTWALPLCSTALGKTMFITGFTFDGVVVHECESVCPACGKCLDAECAEAVCNSKCQGHAHVCESKCATCNGCKDATCEETICGTKCGCMAMTIGSKAYTATAGMWAYNQTITTSTAANKAIWIFDKNYTGSFSTNGFGVALVLNAEGKVARVYDGANGSYSDATVGSNKTGYGVTSSNFATMAWESLQDGEILVVLPNGGSPNNAARGVGLDCRWLIGQKMNLVSPSYKI